MKRAFKISYTLYINDSMDKSVDLVIEQIKKQMQDETFIKECLKFKQDKKGAKWSELVK